MSTEGVVACVALVVSLLALALAVDERRRNDLRAMLVMDSIDKLLELDVEADQRINQVETFVYSGGAVDQRELRGE